MTRVGIVGSAGYTAGELIRILLRHPYVEIAIAYSTSSGGRLISDVHQDLVGETSLRFSDHFDEEVDLLFLCVDHGQASVFLREHPWLLEKKIIDLSNEFRLNNGAHDFVYALPELHRETIRTAEHCANPGCFATAIQLALLPLAAQSLLTGDVHIQAITGSTGAGRKQDSSQHFSWRNNNVQVYKAFTHQHLPEIQQSVGELQPTFNAALRFIPLRGSFSRGILSSVYTHCQLPQSELIECYRNYYASHPFVHLVDESPDVKRVVNTNKALLHVSTFEDQVLIVSVIDNLLKGASGQAVQNMNLMCGYDESTALHLKAVAF